LAENIFSVIHEVGHAFFQANINPEFEFTPLVSEMGLGLHESQSRMLENYIAKRKSF
jgi:carboxypeptidase Taq